MKCSECGREGSSGECPTCGHWNNATVGQDVWTKDFVANLLGVEAPFKEGDRVEQVGGDCNGLRGFVTKVNPKDQTPIHWTGDDGSKIKTIAKHVRRAPPNPAGWVPSCGDRVRMLTGAQKGRSAFVVNTKRAGRTFVALLARDGAVAGPYVDNDLELVSAAQPGPCASANVEAQENVNAAMTIRSNALDEARQAIGRLSHASTGIDVRTIIDRCIAEIDALRHVT